MKIKGGENNMKESKYCFNCGEEIAKNARTCIHCGCIQPQVEGVNNERNRITAGLLGIFLGGLGIHKFYLKRIGQGIIYLLFCWTFIPGIIGFIEGITYLCMSDEDFNCKYN